MTEYHGSIGLWSDDEKPVSLLAPRAPTEAEPSEAVSASAQPATPAVDRAEPALIARGSAADFAAERMLREPPDRPATGWRRGVYRLSGGLIRVGPNAAEVRQRELVARVKTPIRGCRKIAFISRKGGVGKTTTCLLAGHTFATYRGDRVIALDGNPDAGTLGHRIPRETAATITSLLDDADVIERYADIRAYTSQSPTRLETIAGDDDPRITEALAEEDFRRAIDVLERHYNLVCLDTGPGVLESATQGILHAADQIVVVIPPSLDGARAASSTLDWLEENEHGQLVDGAVAVVNGIRGHDGAVDLDRIEDHFAGRCRATVRIPSDPHLELGVEVVVEELRPETRQAYLELAAAVAAGFDDSYGRRL
jgi:putative peptide zinc metalloprotease protein